MEPLDVKERVGDLPWMALEQAVFLTNHLRRNQLSRCLEIGTMHGVSTSYIAAAIQPMNGSLTTIDLPWTENLNPSVETLLGDLNLSNTVTVLREKAQAGAGWVMMEWLEQSDPPVIDFCYIDANHSWDCTGFLFFLVDRFLRPGGWLLFDDIKYYTIAKSTHQDTPWAKKLTEKERTTCQVGKVWNLLVKQHTNYCNFQERENWGLCQKNAAPATG